MSCPPHVTSVSHSLLTHKPSTQSPPPSLTKENLGRQPDGPYPIHDYLNDHDPSEAFHAGSGIQVDVAERRKDMGARLDSMLACFQDNGKVHPRPVEEGMLHSYVLVVDHQQEKHSADA